MRGRYAALNVARSKWFKRRSTIAQKPLQSRSKDCSKLVPELLHSWSKVVPRFALRGRYAALSFAWSKWFESCSTIAQAALAHCSRIVPGLSKNFSNVGPQLLQGSPCGLATRPCTLRGRDCSEHVPELFQSRFNAAPRIAPGLFQNCSNGGPKLLQASPCGDATRP